ncbi:hypothetical protein C8Q78DRAFT_1016367 [Trametes maxima]|nr:hypothetical protein C8Q78DRAFT_1016367 [Trametes maxima]
MSHNTQQLVNRLPTYYQSGFCIMLDALHRYFEQGQKRSCGPPLPETPGPDAVAHLEDAESQQQELCRLWKAKEAADNDFVMACDGAYFHTLRRFAPPEIKQHLLIPHLVSVHTAHTVLRSYFRLLVFIPVGLRTEEHRKAEPTSGEIARMLLFRDCMNRLIKDQTLRESAGLAPEDFKWLVVPESAVGVPFFSDEQCRELRENPELRSLYYTTHYRLGLVEDDSDGYLWKAEIARKTMSESDE